MWSSLASTEICNPDSWIGVVFVVGELLKSFYGEDFLQQETDNPDQGLVTCGECGGVAAQKIVDFVAEKRSRENCECGGSTAPVHSAYIEQLKFLRVVCAGRYLKKSPKICRKKTFFF